MWLAGVQCVSGVLPDTLPTGLLSLIYGTLEVNTVNTSNGSGVLIEDGIPFRWH